MRHGQPLPRNMWWFAFWFRFQPGSTHPPTNSFGSSQVFGRPRTNTLAFQGAVVMRADLYIKSRCGWLAATICVPNKLLCFSGTKRNGAVRRSSPSRWIRATSLPPLGAQVIHSREPLAGPEKSHLSLCWRAIRRNGTRKAVVT